MGYSKRNLSKALKSINNELLFADEIIIKENNDVLSLVATNNNEEIICSYHGVGPVTNKKYFLGLGNVYINELQMDKLLLILGILNAKHGVMYKSFNWRKEELNLLIPTKELKKEQEAINKLIPEEDYYADQYKDIEENVALKVYYYLKKTNQLKSKIKGINGTSSKMMLIFDGIPFEFITIEKNSNKFLRKGKDWLYVINYINSIKAIEDLDETNIKVFI